MIEDTAAAASDYDWRRFIKIRKFNKNKNDNDDDEEEEEDCRKLEKSEYST